MTRVPDKSDIHPNGDSIDFFEASHRYQFRSLPNMELVSATTWIAEFFPTFDKEKVSAQYARKHNMLQADVLAMWEQKGHVARERGTLVHAKAEQAIKHYMQTGEILALSNLLCGPMGDGVSEDPEHTDALISCAHQAVSKMSEVLDFSNTERIVASPELGIAGMIDLVVKLRTDRGVPVVGLYDWKTNAKIEKHNQWQNGLDPVSHLSHCSFNHYALQLNLYEYLCRKEGYYPEETVFQKVLIHLTPNGYATHKCPDLQHNIEAMLETLAPRSIAGKMS